MKRVAAYALFTVLEHADQVARRFEAVCVIIEAWLVSKGERRQVDDGCSFVLNDGRIGSYMESSFSSAEGEVVDRILTEPSNNALVRTQVSVCVRAKELSVYVELQAAGGAYQLGPMRVDIRCPAVVRSLVQAYGDWQVGEVPITAVPHRFEGPEGGAHLEKVIWHDGRNLPVLVVSSHEGAYLTETFSAELASELVGVAIVATVDADAARLLTNTRGKEWSCFNGAVRLYWPHPALSKPQRHPLWMRSSLLNQAPNAHDASAKFRRQMRRQLLGLSAFAMPEPESMSEIRAEHQRMEDEQVRATLRGAEDWRGLANIYADANDKLNADAKALREQLRTLESEVANLQYALQWRPEDAPEIAPEVEIPPATMEEAIKSAKQKFADTLVFGDDVGIGIAGLSATAGPPEKVLSYLSHLGDMVALRRKDELGMAPLKWLQQRGVDCSAESVTIRNSPAEQKRRTWHDGSGARVFEMHLKPTEATHPDRCVRIYFDYDPARKVGIVGWIGRHP